MMTAAGRLERTRRQSGASSSPNPMPRAVAMVEKDWQAHIDFNKEHFPFNFKAWLRDGEVLDDVNFAQLLDRGLMFIGSAETVEQRIREFFKEAGGFGTFLMVTGRDWGTFGQRQASMESFAERVVPAIRPIDAHGSAEQAKMTAQI